MATNIQTEFKRIFWLFFKDFCTNCTLHGLRYFVVPLRHWSERLWWVLSVGLALWLSYSMIHTFWLDWQENPMTMTATKEVDPISKSPFPTVVICPESKVLRDKFDLSSKFNSNNQLLPNISHTDKMRLLQLVHVCRTLTMVIPYKQDFADDDIFSVIEDLAPKLEHVIDSCSWKGAIINCSEYLKPVMTYFGVCFTFNGLNTRDIYTDEMASGAIMSKSNPSVSQWSVENGYEREFERGEYPIRVFDSDESTTLEINLRFDKRNFHRFCQMISQGFNVFLMPPYDTNIMTYEAVGVAPSEDTHIQFAPKLTTTSNGLRKYSPLRRDCFFQSERRLRFFKTYSSVNCLMECRANFVQKTCGCVGFSMPRDNDTKICGATKMNCFLRVLDQISSFTLSECLCLPACTTTEYSLKIDQFEMKQLNKSQQQARLKISLQKYEVKTMQRAETVTVSDFLAMCGGILGLFMGFSALSVVEIIYYPFLRFYWMIQRLKEDNDKEKSNERAKNDDGTSTDKKNRAHSKKRPTRLRKFLVEYCDNSNIHGFRYFSHRNLHRNERYYWALACVVSLSLCGWMTYNVWYQWQSSPMLIRSAKEKPNTFSIPLPTVTICPEVKSTKEKFDLTSALNNRLKLSDIETQRLNALANVCPRLLYSEAFEDQFANESIYDTIKDIAPQFEHTLPGCSWSGALPLRRCAGEITSILTDEGVCFAFNAFNSHDMYTHEMASGMRLDTGNPNVSHWSLEGGYDSRFHKDEYPTRRTYRSKGHLSLVVVSIDKRNFEQQCNRFYEGFKLILTPPGEVLKMSRNSYRIHLNNFNVFHVETKTMKTSEGLRSYKPTQRQCFYQSERQLRFYKMYTRANCEEECLANFTSVECGCVHFLMPRDNKTKICGAASVVCLKVAQEKFLMDKSSAAFHGKCDCLPACVSIEYKARIQRLKVPTNADIYRLKAQHNEIAVIALSIINVESEERVERFTVTDFLAYCGGLLGVCMGISALSIIEITYFATLRLFWMLRRWKSENSVAPLNQEDVEVIETEDVNE